jgi:hypothetical protein
MKERIALDGYAAEKQKNKWVACFYKRVTRDAGLASALRSASLR